MFNFGADVSFTRILIIINILTYIGTSLASSSYVQTSHEVLILVGQANYLVLQGYFWQILTSIFVHANLIHLFGNMLFLMIFGMGAEVLYGHRQYLIIYFSSGLFGSILSLFTGLNSVSAGSSGAIFGLFGAATIYSDTLSTHSILMALVYSIYFLILNIGANVNVYAHAGGLLIGLLLGYKYTKRFSIENHG